nr:A24 family peptidase [Kibdelosporangium sp. MJ126-NF4]CEL22741.1 putative type IV peptidase [Kibdelosporangium sp. MJ126-NF4]CTQ89880.1 putative type IV peptidase [Kibdelosporangium sp. MJ126-NF4]
MVLIVCLLAGGYLAGAAGRWLLRRLRRGATVRHGWCEGACAVLWALAGLAHVSATWLLVLMALSWFAVLLTVTDVVHGRLPDALTLSAYPVFGLLLAFVGSWERGLMGAALFLCLHMTVRCVAPSSLGGGDVKLSGSLGAILGAVSWFALSVGLMLAAVITLALRAVSAGRYPDRVPHGPGLLAATWLLALLPAGLPGPLAT